MEFRILGPLEVLDEGTPLALGGIKARALLAVLLLSANESVSAERLSVALWGEDVPASAVKTVQVYVSRLRKALGHADVLETTTAGYRLQVGEDELDAARFMRLVRDGQDALAAGEAERAAAVLREALSLWRGQPLADLEFEPFAQAEIARLREQRLAAVEARVEADLAAGQHAALVGELRRLVRANPTRERLAAQMMLALYRCGRQADALQAFQEARRVLLADIGVEPGPELRRLEAAILRQDDSLESQAAVPELPQALDGEDAPSLVGRHAELARLRGYWDRARAGCGVLVIVTGAPGIGKSRLVVEFAGELHREGATVLYVDGAGSPPTAMDVLGRARAPARPTLLVVDDADRAGPDLLSDLCVLADGLAAIPVLAIVTGTRVEALASLGDRESLPLGPLALEAVAAISAQYAPGGAGEQMPAEWLAQTSAGVPRRVHEIASRWGRHEVARRVSAVAGRAAAGRNELRSMELELAGDVIELQVARERVALERHEDTVVCPFKGLASFDVADAAYFFGRERLVAQLVARLVGAPVLGVVGPSGCGKSSVLRAGLLPALAGGVLPGSERWTQAVLRPGEHPLRGLDIAVSGLDGDAGFVLAVDQFEETFTACGDERERAAFVAELVRMANAGPGVVVLSVRADHYGRCAAYPRLAGLLATNHVLVGPMRHDELRRAVTCPARRAGLLVDPDLADALVADVEHEPGSLPLLSAALLELWQQRDGRCLRLDAYERTGGVRGAVARLAEDAFAQLDETSRPAARDLVMRLVELTADGEVERRRVPLPEIVPGDGTHDVTGVLALLTDRRLLTVSTGTIEIAHEALLREWPRLSGWIEEDRDDLRIRRGLGSAAREWHRLDRDEGALYRGARLAEVIEWRAARAPSSNELECEFLEASEAGLARDRTARQRRTRLMGAALATLAAAAVAVVATLLFADRERDAAASRDLAAKSSALLATDPGLALTLALEALRRRDTRQARNVVRQATFAHRETLAVNAHDGLAYGVAVSPDGGRAATAGGDGTVRVWRLDSGRRVAEIRTGRGEVRAVSFSRDGTMIAAATREGAIVVAPTLGGPVEVVATLPPDEKFATSIEFGAGDRTLVFGTDRGAAIELRRRGRSRRALTAPSPGGMTAARLDDGARRIVSVGYGGFAQISNLGDGKRGPAVALDHGARLVLDAAFAPDGKRAATVDEAGALRLWNANSGELLATHKIDDKPLVSVRFSGDGRRLVASAYDGLIHVLTAEGTTIGELRGHHGASRAAFAPGGAIVSAGEDDGTLRTWAVPPTIVSTTSGLNPRFDREGQRVVSGDASGRIHVWTPRSEQERVIGAKRLTMSDPRLAPAGDTIVSVSGTETVRMWDVASGRQREVPTLEGRKLAAAIDPTGERIAVGGQTPLVIQRLDGRDRKRMREPPERINALAFSPGGDRLLAAADEETPRIWEVASGRLERLLRGHEGVVRGVSYSPDGRLIATAGSDATVRVWSAGGGDPVVLLGHQSAVNTAAFDDSGQRLVSAADDGTVRVWDAGGGEPLAVLHQYEGVASGADFGDGHTVVSAGDGIMRITPCEVCGSFMGALRVARTRTQRALSNAERRLLLPGG